MNKVAIAAFIAALVKQLASCNPPLAPEDIYSNIRKTLPQLSVEELTAALRMVDELYYFLSLRQKATIYVRQRIFLGFTILSSHFLAPFARLE